MPTIRQLPDTLINKIAAGEVIERPANIVKELIENSLDAGAKHLTIRLEKGGKKRISIEDDGTGLSDPASAIKRHTTSKIYSEKDLDRIATLGFRGEALASICAVARVEIASKTKGLESGNRLVIEGGEIIESSTIPMDDGTRITVSDVFYNTPARQKFLKSDVVERRHCQDIITKLSFCDTTVDIKAYHDETEIFHATPHEDLIQRISSVYGLETAKSMIPVSIESEHFSVTGAIGIPYSTRKDKSKQVMLINDRPVKAPAIETGVYDAYQSFRFLETHPVFIISVRLDHSLVDVNVHPTKQEVRLSQGDELERIVFEACSSALESKDLTPNVSASTKVKISDQQSKLSSTTESDVHDTPSYTQTQLDRPDPTGYMLQESDTRQDHQTGDATKEATDSKGELTSDSIPTGDNKEIDDRDMRSPPRTEQEPEEKETIEGIEAGREQYHDFGIRTIYGQFTRLYILASSRQGLIIIDQHAAEERVLYEEFLEQFQNGNVASQHLFKPLIIEVSPLQMEEYVKNRDVFERSGFTIDEFGERELKVSAIPELFSTIDPSFFSSLLDEFNLARKGQVTSSQSTIIATKACKKAIKAGDELTQTQMRHLIERMQRCKRPYTCPHGRPTIISITPDELEKMFRRKA
ncbi:MAG: DNA mismatch repair endonuclease MutL [Nanoarchaeota archaeon]